MENSMVRVCGILKDENEFNKVYVWYGKSTNLKSDYKKY